VSNVKKSVATIADAWALINSRQLKPDRRWEVGPQCFCIRFLIEVAETTWPSFSNSPRIRM
jgi:hypothetical protein